MSSQKSDSPTDSVDVTKGESHTWTSADTLEDTDPGLYLSSNHAAHGHHVSSAYYDYETDKHLSQADAKLFYQRHRMDQRDARSVGAAYSHSNNAVANSSREDGSGVNENVISIEREQPSPISNAEDPVRHPGKIMQDVDRLASINTPELHANTGPMGEAGPGSFANQDPVISSELTSICGNIQRILDLRHKYIRLSLQRPGDNPKDDSRWRIYPDPLDRSGTDLILLGKTIGLVATPTAQTCQQTHNTRIYRQRTLANQEQT